MTTEETDPGNDLPQNEEEEGGERWIANVPANIDGFVTGRRVEASKMKLRGI
jgi:hypothetical protein